RDERRPCVDRHFGLEQAPREHQPGKASEVLDPLVGPHRMEQGTRDVRLTQGFWQLGDIATVAHMPVVVVHDEGDSQAAVGGGHGDSSSAATVWRRANWSWYSLWPASPNS